MPLDVRPAGHDQLVRREPRDHLATVCRDHDLLLDPCGRAAVARGAVRLEREDHALLDFDRVVEGVQPRDHRRFVEADAESVPELEPEAVSSLEKPSSSAVGQTAAI